MDVSFGLDRILADIFLKDFQSAELFFRVAKIVVDKSSSVNVCLRARAKQLNSLILRMALF